MKACLELLKNSTGKLKFHVINDLSTMHVYPFTIPASSSFNSCRQKRSSVAYNISTHVSKQSTSSLNYLSISHAPNDCRAISVFLQIAGVICRYGESSGPCGVPLLLILVLLGLPLLLLLTTSWVDVKEAA